MRKTFLLVLLGLCLAVSVHAVSGDVSPGSNKPTVNAPNPAMKSMGNQNMPQVVKGAISPNVTINKPDQYEVWEAGKSYPVEWESKFISPGSSGTVMLDVMVTTASNCQPVTNIQLNGQTSYKVPFASSSWGISPHGKFMATLSVTFIDKATNKEYKDGRVIFVQYP
jgi:hypothetical protein